MSKSMTLEKALRSIRNFNNDPSGDDWGDCEVAFQKFGHQKPFVLNAVKQSGVYLSLCSDELKNDPEIVKLSVQSFGWSLQWASPEMKDNEEIVLMAVKAQSSAFEHASVRLRDSKQFVLQAIKVNQYSYEYASESIVSFLESSIGNEARIKALEEGIIIEMRIQAHEKLQTTLAQKIPGPKQEQKMGLKI